MEEESVRSSMQGSRKQEELSIRDDIQEPSGPEELSQPAGRGDYRSSNEYPQQQRDGSAAYRTLRGANGGATPQQFYLREQRTNNGGYAQRPVSGN